MPASKPRWVYLDLCRILAIFFVVFGHVVASQWHIDPIGSANWTILNTYASIFRFCIPLFFLISGALLLAPDREISLKKLYGNNILRFIICILFWGSVYYLYVIYRWAPEDFTWKLFITQILGGHPYQHWFLFEIIGLYMILPILKLITKNREACKYFLLLWGFFQIAATSLRLTENLFFQTDSAAWHWINELLHFADNTTPGMVMGYSGYMVLGYYLHETPPKPRNRHIIQVLGIAGAAVTAIANYAICVRDGVRLETFSNNFSAAVGIAAVAVFITFRALFPTTTQKPNKRLTTLSEYSFGVYLAHDFILVFLREQGFTAGLFTRVLSPFVVALAIYGLSLLVVFIIKRIPILKKYIV